MTTTMHRPAPTKWVQCRDRFRYWRKNYAFPFVKARVKHYALGIRQNVYSIFGLVCFCAAGYVHSLFAGLIVTGASWFALELKTRGT